MTESSPVDTPDTTPDTAASADAPVGVHPAEFPEMTNPTRHGTELPLDRFLDVSLQASVELGQVEMSIGEVLKLGEGAVVQLNREVTDPVDIFVQGIRLAQGEVVIVEDSYAVRITQVERGQLGQMHAQPSNVNTEGATS
ncbi:MAG: flagellar motor switch protein FliN [Planctomycetaceae bacterium]|nr:flagellar motor switch protein FliN [Planctomycetaceae bacterium]